MCYRKAAKKDTSFNGELPRMKSSLLDWKQTPPYTPRPAGNHPWTWLKRLLFVLTASILAVILGDLGAKIQLDLLLASTLYFLLVLGVSIYAGFWSASVVSLVAVLCETYFIAPPKYDWHVASTRSVVTIVAFEVSVLLVTRLSTHKEHYALETERQRVKLQNLYELTRSSLEIDPSISPEQQLAELLCDAFSLDAVLLHSETESRFGAAGNWAGIDPNHLLHEALRDRSEEALAEEEIQSIKLEGPNIRGTLTVEGSIRPSTLQTVAALIMLVLERHESYLNVATAEAARRAEQMRVTVLDSLAHAFKTPLTVIRAASAGLLEEGALDNSMRHLADLIENSAQEMTDLASRLLQTARINPEDVQLNLQPIDLGVLLNDVVYHAQESSAAKVLRSDKSCFVHLQLPAVPLRVSADYNLLRAILSELIDNALKYSENSQPVTVRAWQEDEDVTLSVHSWSGVISSHESERIFQRFYRGSSHQDSVPGSGLGLSIARVATAAHQGDIWVHSEEDQGTTFYISLPENSISQPHTLARMRIDYEQEELS
jgi:two-component system sensor histidine kinase KdpD